MRLSLFGLQPVDFALIDQRIIVPGDLDALGGLIEVVLLARLRADQLAAQPARVPSLVTM
jgi:hypothetical protein